MGYCQVGGSTQSCDKETCSEFGGNYFDEDNPQSCFLLSVLRDERAILMAGTMMYPVMIQFRDDVLRRTRLGRKLIAYFDEFYEEAKTIARKDPELVTEIIWLTTYVFPFLQASLGGKPVTDGARETPTSRQASQYLPSTHRAFCSVVERFKRSASKPFAEALDDSERMLAQFVGRSPQETLEELRRPQERTAS